MQYMLIIAQPPSEPFVPGAPGFDESVQAWGDFTRDIMQSGVLVSGASLQPTTTATTVKFVDNATSLVDGPFAETKEAFAGYYLINVDDLDAALAWAKKLPVGDGSVEVRPVAMMPDADGNPVDVN
ncbi:MAG: YciI family protein [Pseudolysinimonas sp.]